MRIGEKSLTKTSKRLTYTYKFYEHDINKFFYCCKNVFTHMNTWMIGKNLMEHHDLRKKIFIFT